MPVPTTLGAAVAEAVAVTLASNHAAAYAVVHPVAAAVAATVTHARAHALNFALAAAIATATNASLLSFAPLPLPLLPPTLLLRQRDLLLSNADGGSVLECNLVIKDY